MTAVVGAMLGIVIVATMVLASVGGYHHMTHSPRTRRKIRRWRYVARSRVYEARGRSVVAMLALRRRLAGRLAGTRRRPRALAAAARRALPD